MSLWFSIDNVQTNGVIRMIEAESRPAVHTPGRLIVYDPKTRKNLLVDRDVFRLREQAERAARKRIDAMQAVAMRRVNKLKGLKLTCV